MLRFFVALWAAKLVMFVNKLRGNLRDDWPGLLAFKLCPRFLEYIRKPKLVITITGTNGKTTTSNLINDFLREQGLSVSHNDWGANLYAGFALNLMRTVNIFNKTIMDASVMEADELTLDDTMTMIEPNYILVTNICKDSLRRNGHPENIFNHINRTFEVLGGKTKAVLNANDPISSRLGENSPRVYYSVEDLGLNPRENIVKDISVCPVCGGNIKYNYRHYRHIGDFFCDSCSYKTPESKYVVKSAHLEGRSISVMEGDQETAYPLISDNIFNAFNVLSCISILRELGFERSKIADFLGRQKITEFRETIVEFNGIEYYTYGAKSQNVSAASTVFEYMAKEPSKKDVVLLLDELQDRNHPPETVTWLYETDYEFLNSPNINKIIVGGAMFLNHRLRMLLAGIPPEKMVCVENEADIVDHVSTEGIDKVYVLFEIDYVTKGKNMRDRIVEKAKEIAGR